MIKLLTTTLAFAFISVSSVNAQAPATPAPAPAPAACTLKKADVETLIKEACGLIQENATTAFGKLITEPKFKQCESYVWVNDAQNKNFMIFHPRPTLLGKTMRCKYMEGGKEVNTADCLKDPTSKKALFDDGFDVQTKKPGNSGWVQYNWTKNKSSDVGINIEPKCSYVLNCGVPKAGAKPEYVTTEHVAGFGFYATCQNVGVKDYIDLSK